jgi:MoaA/NifB/PqqE/SkfB family radical SAM enzyme
MSGEVYSRIEEYLHLFKFVHFCGFGEPLMNPRVEEMIRSMYERGCDVSLVTNGLLLTGERISRILAPDSKVREIAISIDAAHKESYEEIRGNGNFDRLVSNLEELKRQVEASPHKPWITWAFLLLKDNFEELPDAVELAAKLGFYRIVGKHVETGKDNDDLQQALFDTGYAPSPDEQTLKRYQAALQEAEKRATSCGIRLEVHPPRLIIDETCGSQPLRALYIDYLGNVSSCCYLNITDVRPYLKRPPDADNGVMGNILETPLDEIIASPRFEGFISQWAEGTLPPACRGCIMARRMRLK